MFSHIIEYGILQVRTRICQKLRCPTLHAKGQLARQFSLQSNELLIGDTSPSCVLQMIWGVQSEPTA
jgi:hypothetical protein